MLGKLGHKLDKLVNKLDKLGHTLGKLGGLYFRQGSKQEQETRSVRARAECSELLSSTFSKG